MLSLIPFVIVLASLLKFLPVDNVALQILGILSSLMPSEAMTMVLDAVRNVMEPGGHVKAISLGILGYLWAATGGFSALIEALDVAYNVEQGRPWWRDRLQALLLTLTVGLLAILSLLTILVGPHFGHTLLLVFPLSPGFALAWPVLRWVVTVVTFVTGMELVYYLGPHCRHPFWSTLPGASVAVVIWFLGSFGLSFYLSNIANYGKLYGSLGTVIALMFWLFITSLAVLTGAEWNAEYLARKSR